MAADAILGLGARLYYSTDDATYTELTDLKEIGSPGNPTIEQIESTPLNPTNRRREFLAGLIDGGRFTFMQMWNKSRYNTLKGFADAGTNLYWRIDLPDSGTSTDKFRGALSQCTFGPIRTSEIIMITCEVQVSGDETFTPA